MNRLVKLLSQFDDWIWSLLEPIFTGGREAEVSVGKNAKSLKEKEK